MFRRALLCASLVTLRLAAQDAELVRKIEAARRLKNEKSFPAAVRAYEAVLPAVRDSRERAFVGSTLLEAGQSALAAGRYDRASEWASAAAPILRDQKKPGDEALAWNIAGSAHLYRAEYDDATACFRKAFDADRQHNDDAGATTRLSNIGGVYFLQGKYLDAQDIYEQALARTNAAAGASWSAGRKQLVLANLAILYEQLGQHEKALDYYQQALSLGPALTTSDQIQILSSIGTLHRRLGEAEKALATYRRAQKLLEHEPQSAAEIHLLQNIGIVQALDFHDLTRAGEAFNRALELAGAAHNRREAVLAHLFRGEAYYRMRLWADAAGDFAEALHGARDISGREEEWAALYGKGRLQRQGGDLNRALATFREAIAIIESIRSGLGASALKTEFLGDKRQVYDAAIGLMLREPECDTGQLFTMIEQARSRNLQDLLSNRAPAPNLAAVQSKLRPGSMLLDYWTGADQVAALWVTPHASGVVSRELPPEQAASLRRLDWAGSAAALLGGIPLDSSLTDLLIAPDGPLAAVPFEALPVAPGGPLLVERYAVTYLPSAALLFRTGAPPKPALPWKAQLVGFGDPMVNAGSALAVDQRWSRLPESARELRSIARAIPGRARINAGRDDLKRFLVSEAAGARLLHLSTHAAADTTDSNRSRILFTAEPGQRGSGYLFRNEVQSLPLGDVDLVTLSACDTEGGNVLKGEGVQSFSRAFLAAGARSTVTTLWRVADGPTADFMTIFYGRLAQGGTKAQALRAAKLAFLRSGTELAQPKYWAAFVLNGDGQEPIPAVYSWWWFIGAAGTAALLIVIYRRRLAQAPTWIERMWE